MRLVVERPEESGAPVLDADGARLLQLFSNLVGNAVKFTPAGGTVTVRWRATRDDLAVSVADEGPGIPGEALPHLFTAFWQAGSADRRGVGLGLWIARAIAEAHGGRIWADSEPGGGSVFHFTLPVVAARAAAPSAPAQAVAT